MTTGITVMALAVYSIRTQSVEDLFTCMTRSWWGQRCEASVKRALGQMVGGRSYIWTACNLLEMRVLIFPIVINFHQITTKQV